MVDICQVDPRPLLKACGLHVDLPTFSLAGIDEGEAVAVGGLAWDGSVCWLFFHMIKPEAKYRFKVIACAKRLLRHARQLGETDVYTPRDAELKTSQRLLQLLRFEPFACEIESRVEIWRWHSFH
jgi:hypothetical protein